MKPKTTATNTQPTAPQGASLSPPSTGGVGGGSFSPHFTLSELTRSAKARELKLKNIPDANAIENLERLCRNVLEPLRSLFGGPLQVTSAFRSQAVNNAVGGVPNSQHIAGEAADITVGSPEQNRRLLGLALAHPDKVPFDQIIAESCDKYGNPRWIHISYGARNRRQAIYS